MAETKERKTEGTNLENPKAGGIRFSPSAEMNLQKIDDAEGGERERERKGIEGISGMESDRREK